MARFTQQNAMSLEPSVVEAYTGGRARRQETNGRARVPALRHIHARS